MSRNVPTSHMACFQFSYNTTFLLLSYLNSNWMSSVLLKKFSSRDVWLACGSSCVCINCCIPCAACFSSTTRSVTRNLIGTKYKLGNGVRSVSQVVYFGKTRLIIPKVPLARRGHLNIVQVRVSCVSYIFPPRRHQDPGMFHIGFKKQSWGILLINAHTHTAITQTCEGVMI